MYSKKICTKYIGAYLFSVLLAIFTFSCKKESVPNKPMEPSAVSNKYNVELAYPGMVGESVGIKLGNDSCYLRKIGDKYIWMGDIVLDSKQKDSLIARYENVSNARTFQTDLFTLWPNAEVFYVVDPSFNTMQQQQISTAISHWASLTALKFTPRTTQANYVRFVLGAVNSGLYSTSIGMNGGQQIINLEAGFGTGNVIHEIGHNIGFFHEQCRTDRDKFIKVYTSNIIPQTAEALYQFKIYTEIGKRGYQLGSFDFGSIMLYSSTDFSTSAAPAMTKLDGSQFTGQRDGLSSGDIETANYMYKPVYAYFTKDINFISDPSDMWNDIREEDYQIKFFSDANYTQPVSLTNRVVINYTFYRTEFRQRVPTTTSKTYSITLEPGSNTYNVVSTSWHLSYDGSMNPIDGSYSEEASLQPGIGYR
ncbi:M12 family metallopeptidase [Chitinophaga sp. Cy-1792]|uniref:M12 family metallopeptidase n=1 Tax=Chitinophaga sp. Cy-1792 TaxID=2608339 RepID=UPI00142300E9|nr:M12 family metallopeptidase [Chitinophaga sp. Cy-1792]NIG53866.1 hypothetical protein [Chitinophaga sp. Cy-1792]